MGDGGGVGVAKNGDGREHLKVCGADGEELHNLYFTLYFIESFN